MCSAPSSPKKYNLVSNLREVKVECSCSTIYFSIYTSSSYDTKYMSVGNWLIIVCLNWSLYTGIRKVLSDQFNFELKLKIKTHIIRRRLFLPQTGFRASRSLFSVGDKRGHEARKLVCGRNKHLLIVWFLIFNKKSDLNSRNSKVKLNDQLIVTISMWAISLTHYS